MNDETLRPKTSEFSFLYNKNIQEGKQQLTLFIPNYLDRRHFCM